MYIFTNTEDHTEQKSNNETQEKVDMSSLDEGWSISEFVDDFGDKTGEMHVSGQFSGLMSNTATTASEATILFYFKNDGKSFIRIFEYNSRPVTGYSSGTPYKFSFRCSDDTEESFTWKWYNTNNISFGPQNTEKMKNILKLCHHVRLVVTDMSNPTSKYRFSIPCSEFRKIIKKL